MSLGAWTEFLGRDKVPRSRGLEDGGKFEIRSRDSFWRFEKQNKISLFHTVKPSESVLLVFRHVLFFCFLDRIFIFFHFDFENLKI